MSKILLDAKNKMTELEEESKAKEIATEIINMIDILISEPCRQQSEVDKLNELYESLKDEYKTLIINADEIENVNALSQYESYALAAANEVKDSLKSSNSFKLKEVVVSSCTSGSLSPYYVTVRYSGTNSFGGEIDKSSFIDINNEGESVWWSMSALLGGLKENELLMYNDFLQHKGEEYTIDPERIIRNMESR